MAAKGACIAVWGALFLMGATALAAPPPLRLYARRTWSPQSGLPAARVLSFMQAADGALWLGTSNGVYTFDGLRFRAPLALERHMDRDVTAIVPARGGGVWITSDGQGLVHQRNDVAQPYGRPALPHTHARAVLEDRRGDLWVATAGGLARRSPDGSWRTYTTADGLPANNVRRIVEMSDGALWFATSGGIAVWDGSRLRPLRDLDPRAPAVDTHLIHRDPDGVVWVSGRDGSVHRRSGGVWAPPPFLAALEGAVVTAGHRDRAGALWIGTRGRGLGRAIGDALEWLPGDTEDDDAGTIVWIAEDQEGGIWYGGDARGLHQLAERAVSVAEGAVMAAAGPGGDVHVLWRDHTVTRMRDGEIVGPRVAMPPGTYVLSVARDGALWSVASDGVSVWRAGVRTMVPQAPRPGYGGRIFIPDADGAMWIAGSALTRVASDGAIQVIAGVDDVTALGRGRDGQLLVGQRGKVARVGTSGVTTLDLLTGDAVISSLVEDGDVLWVGTNRGLFRSKGGVTTRFGRAEGLASERIQSMARDRGSRLWINAHGGIFSVDVHQAAEVAAGRAATVATSILGPLDGIYARDPSLERFPPVMDAADRLWFVSSANLIAVPTRQSPRAPLPVIEAVDVDGRATTAHAALELPASVHNIEVHFNAHTFVQPERVRFRYRLADLDDRWVDAGTRRSAPFTRLPPGRHRFEVAAANSDGVWSARPTTLTLAVAAPFHRTLPFYAAVGTLIAGLAFAAHRLRLQRERARAEGIAEERVRVARDLHDALIQALTAVSVQLDCVKEELKAPSAAVARHLGLAREQLAASVREVRWTLAVMRSEPIIEGGFAAAIEAAVARLSARGTIALSIDGQVRRFSPAVEAGLLLITREALANAVRHADSARVVVTVTYDEDGLSVVVADEGRGLPDRLRPGVGMTSMRARAAEIGATLTFERPRDGGTRVIARVKDEAG